MTTRSARANGHAGRPHFGPMPSLEREIRDFETDVIRRSHERLVLAEFWAPWCTVCTKLHPALENVAARHAGRVELVSINIEMHPDLAGHAVRGLPTVRAYFAREAVGQVTGVLPEEAIGQWVDGLLAASVQRQHAVDGARQDRGEHEGRQNVNPAAKGV